MNSQKPSLSIAAPAYNEAESLESIITRWVEYLNSSDAIKDYEIVICDDGSSDDTGKILDRMALENPKIRPVHHPVNQGAGAALSTAISATRNEVVLLMDSDGQFFIEDLPGLLEKYNSETPVIMGARPVKNDSLGARFGSWSSSLACNFIYGSKLKDFNSALKLIRGNLARSLILEALGLNYSTEITGKLLEKNIPITEIPVRHAQRQAGKSSMKFLKDGTNRLLFVMYLGMRKFLISRKIIKNP